MARRVVRVICNVPIDVPDEEYATFCMLAVKAWSEKYPDRNIHVIKSRMGGEDYLMPMEES